MTVQVEEILTMIEITLCHFGIKINQLAACSLIIAPLRLNVFVSRIIGVNRKVFYRRNNLYLVLPCRRVVRLIVKIGIFTSQQSNVGFLSTLTQDNLLFF